MLLRRWIYYLSLLAICSSCRQPLIDRSADRKFPLLPQYKAGIIFSNDLGYTEEFNSYTYLNFFNSGGVVIGDINNDGLPEVFFCSKQHSNKLDLSKAIWDLKISLKKVGVVSADV